jgi:hypothetical protein
MTAPRPLALTDSEISTIMALARPLAPSQRTAFLEMIAVKLRGHGELGDGQLYQLCRQLQRELFSPPLATDHGEPGHARQRGGKYA